MRGRDGSDGMRDSGGLEIYDIYDAVEHVKSMPLFADKINPENVHISGYSGGGGNVMSALTKFPDYFNLGASFFGMSDYGFDPVNGWYQNGANVGATRTTILDADIGDPTTGDTAVLDRYHSRASNLASANNPYSEIHLFVNDDETISPPVNSISYRDNAVAGATTPGEFDNITLHIGKSDGSEWVDFNNDGVRQDREIQSWPHTNSEAVQNRGEAWYLDRLLAGEVPAPVLNPADQLFVAGWVRTKHFELFLGDGQNAAAELDYQLSGESLDFDLRIVSNDKSVTGRLEVDLSLLDASFLEIALNGTVVERRAASGMFTYEGLSNGDNLRLVAVVPEPSALVLVSCALVIANRKAAGGIVDLLGPFRLQAIRAEPRSPLSRSESCCGRSSTKGP